MKKVAHKTQVYRISDVVRGCASMVIAVGATHHATKVTTNDLLCQWGERIWTFPEILLSPEGQPIRVYRRDELDLPPLEYLKRDFPSKVWKDADVSRQLVDHYEGNLILSRLELVTLALQCLQGRETTQYLPGDHSYALMGLLRERPIVDVTDSAFQAFARLSLANDSDQLLERMIGVYPKHLNQPWHSAEDAYQCSLWDFYPKIQIAGVGEDDTIIVDGVRAANIRWKSFKPVTNLVQSSWRRIFAKVMIHTYGILLAIFAFMTALVPAFAILLIPCILVALAAPKLIHIIYGGKFFAAQPWLFGIEGYLDIKTIERQIFGAYHNRLQWSAYGSTLSRHMPNKYGDCVGIDPTTDPEVRRLLQKSASSGPGDQKIFTLVDTGSMTVTLFQAARPPVALLLVSSEGGMQRAVGCSLDWTTSTLYRETVLRLETQCRDRMSLVGRVRIGLSRPVGNLKRV